MNHHRKVDPGCNIHRGMGYQPDCRECGKLKDADSRARIEYRENQARVNAVINRQNRKADARAMAWTGIAVGIITILLGLIGSCMGP